MDVFTFNSARVPAPIPFLMMLIRNNRGCFENMSGRISKQIIADQRMILHELKLVLGQFAGLIEHRVRNCDLPDIMHR
ncbi:hypothetical protein D3C85_1733620 [compost metagenome]